MRRLSQVSKFSLIAVCAFAFAVRSFAQALPAVTDIPVSRYDIYAGYGYFHPIDAGIAGHNYVSIVNKNTTVSVTRYFGRYLGAQVEGGYFSGPSVRGSIGQCVNGACDVRDPNVYTAEAGPIVRFPLNRFVPYAHVLGGGARINGPFLQDLRWGYGITAGVGIDYILPYFNNLFAIRPIQVDYQYSHVDYGPLAPDGSSGGLGVIAAYKLSGGLVVRFGVPAVKRPVELGCATQPASVFPGEPVVANADVVNVNPRRTPFYTWTTTGGKLTADASSAMIDTTGLAPGDYTVGGHLSYGKKAGDQATCTAPFTVKAYEPPTMSCTASPSTVTSGTTVDIATSGVSPQNRPLTYSYTASAGQIVGDGPTARLSTAGLGASTITVTCNLADDQGKTATATATVNIENPPPPPPPPVEVHTQALCSVSFVRDPARTVRLSNEGRSCLDDIALTMTQQTDAHLIIVGYSSTGDRSRAAAERALNVREYLTHEKGIDPMRIDVRTGNTRERAARTVLVPSGAVYSDADTRPFDAVSTVHRGTGTAARRKHRTTRPRHRPTHAASTAVTKP
ncbi:MAG: hypothetical protein ABI147_03585 [Acidobacteriaceae bacterium]